MRFVQIFVRRPATNPDEDRHSSRSEVEGEDSDDEGGDGDGHREAKMRARTTMPESHSPVAQSSIQKKAIPRRLEEKGMS